MGKAGDNSARNQTLFDKNRSHHFKFGDGSQKEEMMTVAKEQYDFKGNAMSIRSSLDTSLKQDLKNHHINMGSHTVEYQTSYLHVNPNQVSNA